MVDYKIYKDLLTKAYGEREGENLFQIAIKYASNLYVNLNDKNSYVQFMVDQLLDYQPIQYLTKEAWFYEYPFYVDQRVLIPRPETEELVEIAIELINGNNRVLDIGTGSGAIAISIAKKTSAQLTAIDVSLDALAVAKQNAEKLRVDIVFLQADILEESTTDLIEGQFELIISNPPYIPFREKSKMGKNVVGKEPDLALFVEDKDEIIFYKSILNFASKKLSKQGIVLFECNEFNAQKVLQLKNDYPIFNQEVLLNDMSGKPRMALFKK